MINRPIDYCKTEETRPYLSIWTRLWSVVLSGRSDALGCLRGRYNVFLGLFFGFVVQPVVGGLLVEGQVLLHGEHGPEEYFHLLLVDGSIVIRVNQVVHLVNLLVCQCQYRPGHLHDVLLNLVLVQRPTVVKVEDYPDLLDLREDADIARDLCFVGADHGLAVEELHILLVIVLLKN